MLNRPLNRMTVGSQAHAVSVVASNVRGTGSTKGLNINQQIGPSALHSRPTYMYWCVVSALPPGRS